MSYPDLFNPDLLDRIPLDARVVVDIGCASGALGAEYKRRNPAARVLGIERDPAAARIAEQRLDAVKRADLDADPLPFGDALPPGSVDCLVYGDVLEHLADPWAVLRAQVPLLSEHGIVVICMPNAEHWSFAERLLRGTFAYEPLGLFDQTHLRWFTAETTRRTLRAAGPDADRRDPAHLRQAGGSRVLRRGRTGPAPAGHRRRRLSRTLRRRCSMSGAPAAVPRARCRSSRPCSIRSAA